MKRLVVAGALVAGAASAQEAPPGADTMPVPLTVRSEHEVLHLREGTWTVERRIWLAPGPPIVDRGKQTCRIVLSGLGVACEYATMGDVSPMMGFGFTTWNPLEKKYESYWSDSLSHGGLTHAWGTWDPITSTFTEVQSGKDASGKAFTVKLVTLMSAKDRHLTSLLEVLPDGSEHKLMEYVYNRRK